MYDPSPIMVGIDGGATNSFGVAVDGQGQVLAIARSGTLSFFGSNHSRARRSLTELIKNLELQLPIGARIRHTVVGCAALFAEATDQEQSTLCKGILPLDQVKLVSDCMTAYYGSSLGEPAAQIICGTGSIVLVQNEEHQFVQVGGWGHLLGDEGSAYWMAREAIQAAIRAVDGLGPETSLVSLICHWFQIKELSELVPIVYHPGFSKDKFAALAQFLYDRGTAGEDPVFRGICQRAGEQIAAQLISALNFAHLKIRPVPVYTVGGVITGNELAREAFRSRAERSYSIELMPARLSPLLGAAGLSLSLAGFPVNDAVVERLKSSYAAQANGTQPGAMPDSGDVLPS